MKALPSISVSAGFVGVKAKTFRAEGALFPIPNTSSNDDLETLLVEKDKWLQALAIMQSIVDRRPDLIEHVTEAIVTARNFCDEFVEVELDMEEQLRIEASRNGLLEIDNVN